MPFDTLPQPLKAVAAAAYKYCKHEHGSNGAKTGEELDPDISWRPTFQVKSGVKYVAVEVGEKLYPEILKIAAHDILQSDKPIIVYQACPLETYQLDKKQTVVSKLVNAGVGILTVDEDGNVVVQHSSVPLVQHIKKKDLESELKDLTPKLKVEFRKAHTTYLTHEGQGLQQAGQIVEAMVKAIASSAKKAGVAVNPGWSVADILDKLFDEFVPHRADIGGVRSFVKDFRNTASHPANSAKKATAKIKACKTGFLEAISCAKKLRSLARAKGYALIIHLT